MKAFLLPFALCATMFAQEQLEKSEPTPIQSKLLEGWGRIVNPDEDCRFTLADGALRIDVPGDGNPHDMSAELITTNAPRVLQTVAGDFAVSVKIDGTFAPGDASTQPGRSGYTGAGLLVYSDAGNYVRLERATLQWPGEEPRPYTNFEIRINGQVVRLGTTGDRPIKVDLPTYLRLERRGNRLHGFVSQDNEKWDELPAKELPEDWGRELQAGVAAISTSKQMFTPVYRGLKVTKKAEAQAEQ